MFTQNETRKKNKQKINDDVIILFKLMSTHCSHNITQVYAYTICIKYNRSTADNDRSVQR